jgi:hypothetical protein
MRALPFALFIVGCGAPALIDAPPEPKQAACAFVDVPFSPHGELVQGARDDGAACAILEREPAEERRDTVWRATRLFVSVGERSFDSNVDGVLSYENTHHNCRDLARLGDVSLTIDGVTAEDPSACFDPASDAWVLTVDVDGAQWVLRPR